MPSATGTSTITTTSSTLPNCSGTTWPVRAKVAMAAPLQWLRWLLPGTSGVQASLRLNQLGAPPVAALPQL